MDVDDAVAAPLTSKRKCKWCGQLVTDPHKHFTRFCTASRGLSEEEKQSRLDEFQGSSPASAADAVMPARPAVSRRGPSGASLGPLTRPPVIPTAATSAPAARGATAAPHPTARVPASDSSGPAAAPVAAGGRAVAAPPPAPRTTAAPPWAGSSCDTRSAGAGARGAAGPRDSGAAASRPPGERQEEGERGQVRGVFSGPRGVQADGRPPGSRPLSLGASAPQQTLLQQHPDSGAEGDDEEPPEAAAPGRSVGLSPRQTAQPAQPPVAAAPKAAALGGGSPSGLPRPVQEQPPGPELPHAPARRAEAPGAQESSSSGAEGSQPAERGAQSGASEERYAERYAGRERGREKGPGGAQAAPRPAAAAAHAPAERADAPGSQAVTGSGAESGQPAERGEQPGASTLQDSEAKQEEETREGGVQAAPSRPAVILDDGRSPGGPPLSPGAAAFRLLMGKYRDEGPAGAGPRRPMFRPLLGPTYSSEDPYYSSLTPEALAFFARRGITAEVLRRNRIYCERTFCPQKKEQAVAIAFPYFKHGQLVHVKYRLLGEKVFWSTKGTELVMYGFDDAAGASSVVVVEGEMDKLACDVAGYPAVVSVPNGAPSTRNDRATGERRQVFTRGGGGGGGHSPADPHGHQAHVTAAREHYAYLESFVELFRGGRPTGQPGAAGAAGGGGGAGPSRGTFLLGTDMDEAGLGLRDALRQRLGRDRCYEVIWDRDPLAPGAGGSGQPEDHKRKDANEVLMRDGPERLSAALEGAVPSRVEGLATLAELEAQLRRNYESPDRVLLPRSTGWPCMDPHYKVAPGELTIVTGVPNSGKSEWLDALLVNLAENHGWPFLMCSLEKLPDRHMIALIEKRARKPFYDVRRRPDDPAPGPLVPRMSEAELRLAAEWVSDFFVTLRPEEDGQADGEPTAEWIMDKAEQAVTRYNIRGLVIDPYNMLDRQLGRRDRETSYVGRTLRALSQLAKRHELAVWFVAHPRSQRRYAPGAAPTARDISGSANWHAMADNVISVARRFEPELQPDGKVVNRARLETEVHVLKVRNKAVGTEGAPTLHYDRVTGRYRDPLELEEGYAARLAAREGGADLVARNNLATGYHGRLPGRPEPSGAPRLPGDGPRAVEGDVQVRGAGGWTAA